MRPVTLSAMLVVCSSPCSHSRWRPEYLPASTLTVPGLYYKLHGSHRPVEMKKQEIKRRKRIVPAEPGTVVPQAPPSMASNSPPQRATQTPVLEQSASPASTTAIETSEVAYPPYPRAPPPVDFTSYYSNGPITSHPARTLTPSTKPAPSPRKRSLSATLDPDETPSGPVNPVPHRPNAISSILNPAGAQDANIDPSLSSMSRQSIGPSPGAREDKAARKERLRQEAEFMRQELARRERELQALDED